MGMSKVQDAIKCCQQRFEAQEKQFRNSLDDDSIDSDNSYHEEYGPLHFEFGQLKNDIHKTFSTNKNSKRIAKADSVGKAINSYSRYSSMMSEK